MRRVGGPDARPDQLKLLKLENRHMKPLARALLDCGAAKSTKKAALTGAAAALMALQAAPAEYTARLGVPDFDGAASAQAFAQAQSELSKLSALIESDASRDVVVASVASLFKTIDGEHARFETLARAIGARLLDVAPVAVGDGGGNKNPPLTAWLRSANTDNVGDGGGNKDPLSAWLMKSSMSGR